MMYQIATNPIDIASDNAETDKHCYVTLDTSLINKVFTALQKRKIYSHIMLRTIHNRLGSCTPISQ
jgi:hypothetical protein